MTSHIEFSDQKEDTNPRTTHNLVRASEGPMEGSLIPTNTKKRYIEREIPLVSSQSSVYVKLKLLSMVG